MRAGVDEGVHALGVVGEVLGEGVDGELVAVVADKLCVVVCDLLCLSTSHALARPSLLSRGCERANGSETEEGQRSERDHGELGLLCILNNEVGRRGGGRSICTCDV